jgi:hypothetical protein
LIPFARWLAALVRDYLVGNFGFDDTQLKTLGMAKKTGGDATSGWGDVEIIIYPPGTAIPTDQAAEIHTVPHQ